MENWKRSDLVAKEPIRCGIFVQRHCVAEPQQPKRSQPLDAEAHGFLQLIIVESRNR